MCHLLFPSPKWMKCGHSESELALIVKRKTILSMGEWKKNVKLNFFDSFMETTFLSPDPPILC